MKKNMVGFRIVEGYFIATVVRMGMHFGFVKRDDDMAQIDGSTSYEIVAGEQYPEFGEDYGPVPVLGEKVVVCVQKTPAGWRATGWGVYSEFLKAQMMIAQRKCPKPAPPIPQKSFHGGPPPTQRRYPMANSGRYGERSVAA